MRTVLLQTWAWVWVEVSRCKSYSGGHLKLFCSLNRLKIFASLLYLCFDVAYYVTKPCCLSFAGRFFLSHCCDANSTRKKWVSHKGLVNQMCVIICINMFSKVYSVALIDLELLENQPRNEHFPRAVDRNDHGPCLTSYLRRSPINYTNYKLCLQTTLISRRICFSFFRTMNDTHLQ